MLGEGAGPEAVPVAGDDGEPGDALPLQQVGDLAMIDLVAEADAAIAGDRPIGAERGGQILDIGPESQGAEAVAPYLPGLARAAELGVQPGLLLPAEIGLARRILGGIGDVVAADRDRR